MHSRARLQQVSGAADALGTVHSASAAWSPSPLSAGSACVRCDADGGREGQTRPVREDVQST